MYMYVTEYTYI